MTEVPTWWLVVSAAFFIVNILVWVAMIFVLLTLKRILEETRPKIASLSAKAHQLATRIEEVAHKVEETAESVRETVSNVGDRTKGVVGSVELVANSASKQFERFSPFVVGAMTAMRLIKALNEMRHGMSPKDATKKGILKRKPAAKKSGILDFLLRK